MIESHPPIYFVRHGATDGNRECRIQDHSDIPLNDFGHQQPAAIAPRLKDFRSGRIERFDADGNAA